MNNESKNYNHQQNTTSNFDLMPSNHAFLVTPNLFLQPPTGILQVGIPLRGTSAPYHTNQYLTVYDGFVRLKYGPI